MGGAVSSGESNDDLIDNLLEADYIKSPLVERVFRSVDRAFYYTEPYKQNAYKDLAWKDGNLHLSAPCIYSEVLENLDLGPGMYFLNIGSGTGYFSTMCGLILGKTGVNHGIELYPDVVNYARMKLDEFMRTSPAIDEFEFCPPDFTVGNCLDAIPASKRYDRIYCGAACPENYLGNLVDMLKIGGVCIVPVGDSLFQITRTEEKKDERKILLPVSFATLVSPSKENPAKPPVELPEWSPRNLTDLCRFEIRDSLRQNIPCQDVRSLAEDGRKKKRKRRQERRRASRLVVVQRRRSVELDADNSSRGFVAIAYTVGANSSDEENNPTNRENEPVSQDEVISGTSSDDSRDALSDARHELDGDTIMEEEEEDDAVEAAVKVSPSSSDAMSSSPGEDAGGSQGGVAAVAASASVFPSVNGKKDKTASENGTRETGRRPERRSASATAPTSRGRQPTSGNRPRSARNYTTGAEYLVGRIRELVRARQQDLESMRRQFQRSNSSSEGESGRSRSASARNEDGDADSSSGRNENRIYSDVSSSDSSPSTTATSTSDDEVAALVPSDSSKKRCRNESGDEEKVEVPKPDPLEMNHCSVQMRQKILDLPLPPALKVYLNYDRKLQY